MDSKEIKKAIKENLPKLELDSLNYKYVKDQVIFYEGEEQTGYLAFQFLTGKHIPYGAKAAFYVHARLQGGIVWQTLLDLGLSFRGRPDEYLFFVTSTDLSDKKKVFKNFGKVAFFEGDNIAEKIGEMTEAVVGYFSRKIVHVLLHQMEAIDDILENPGDYSYPMTTILVICWLNDQPFEPAIEKAKGKKLFDGASQRVEEVIGKLSELKVRAK